MISVLLYISAVACLSLLLVIVCRLRRLSPRFTWSAVGYVILFAAVPYLWAAIRTALLDPQIKAQIEEGYSSPDVRVVKILALPYPLNPLSIYVETEHADHKRTGSVALFKGVESVDNWQVWTNNGSLSGNVFPPQWNGDP